MALLPCDVCDICVMDQDSEDAANDERRWTATYSMEFDCRMYLRIMISPFLDCIMQHERHDYPVG